MTGRVVMAAAAVESDLSSRPIPLSESKMRRRRRQRLRTAIIDAHGNAAQTSASQDETFETPTKTKVRSSPLETPAKFSPPPGIWLLSESGPCQPDADYNWIPVSGNGNYDFSHVHNQLDELQSTLCDKLYSDCALLSPMEDSSDDDRSVEPCGSEPSEDNCPGNLDEDGTGLNDTLANHEDHQTPLLAEIRDSLQSKLEHLSRASAMAAGIEASARADNLSMQEVVDTFLQDYYCLMDPAGIEERLLENEMVEAEIFEFDKSFAGHAFTFDRKAFWKCVGKLPDNLRRELVEFGLKHSAHDSPHQLTAKQYESLYHDHAEEAFAWQYMYSDMDDKDDLMTLLCMLSRAVKHNSFL